MGGDVTSPAAMSMALSRLEPDMNRSSGVKVTPYLSESRQPQPRGWTPEQEAAGAKIGLSPSQVRAADLFLVVGWSGKG